MVVFKTANFYENDTISSKVGHSGYGVINLKKMTDLNYPGKYQLDIDPGDILYKPKLTINTNAD